MAKQRNRRLSKTHTATHVGESTGWRGLWIRLSERNQHLLCLLLLCLVSVGFFAPLHFSGKALIGGDTVNWRAMAEYMLAHEEATGEDALWAPNAFGGMPGFTFGYASEVPQLDDVPRLLRTFLWPTSHFIFLLIGTYLLIFLLTGNKLGGVLSAAAFGLTTYLPVLLVAGHNSKFISLCFVPWLAVAFAYALRRPRLLSGLLFAAALALNLRAGHVQITYYAAFLLGIWWVVELVGAIRNGRLTTFGTATLWLAVGSVLGILMVAQPYLVQAEYKDLSMRGAAVAGEPGGLDWTYAMNWSQGFGELITLAVAHAFGGSALYWGPKPFTGGPHYVGGIVLLLSALALWRLRRNFVWAFGIAGLLMIGFSLGEYLPILNRPMFEYFPLFSAFRVPETWLSAVAFILAVLAGSGLYYAARHEGTAEAEVKKTRAVYVVTGTAVALALLLVLAHGAFFSFERPGEYEQLAEQVAQQYPDISPADPQVTTFLRQEVARRQELRADDFRQDALRTLVFLALAGAVLVAHRRRILPGWGMEAALALLVVIDLWGVGRRYVNEDALVPAERIEDQIATYDFDRYILERQEAAGGMGAFRVASFERGSPVMNARPSYHYESVGGYSAAKLRLFQDFIDQVLFDPATGLPNKNALDLLNTRYVVAPVPLPGMPAVYQDEQARMLVLENPDALPRAFFVGATEVVEDAEATWMRLRSDSFDPRQTALLAEPIDFETTPVGEGSTAAVTLQSYAPDEIVWRVRTDAPRLLVASEIYYPAGWEATLDGVPVPIHRVDYLLRGVPVPEGEHTLTMRFEPETHTLGVWISAVATVFVYGGIVVLLGLALVRRRREEPVAEAEPAAEK